MTGRFTVKLSGLNIVPVSALYRIYRGRRFWKPLVTLNCGLHVPRDLGPYGWGVKTKTSLSSAKGKGREEYDEDIRCVTSAWV